MSDNRGYSGASVALSFILGGAMGACLALLYAPEPGRKVSVSLVQVQLPITKFVACVPMRRATDYYTRKDSY